MIVQASDDLRLQERLVAWEEGRDRGESLSVEQLCQDCPELAGELGRRIQVLRDWDLMTPDLSSRSSSAPGAVEPAIPQAPGSACVTLQLNGLRFHDRGGLGLIFKARHDDLPRDVALKFIRQDRSSDPQCAQRFLREARITARLEHPGIVPIYGLGRDESGNPCYAMRFVAGTTLEQAIKQYHDRRDRERDRGLLATDRAFRALIQRLRSACTTVAYAHSRGVLHRDIKPANIMIGPFDETLVLDWGLGKIVASDEAEAAGADDSDAVLVPPGWDDFETCGIIGTPGFMSPEQYAGPGRNVGSAGDIYALGVTLYVLLTGRTPFTGRGAVEIAAKVERGEFTPPRQVRPEITRPLEAICLKAMARDPEARYASAVELADDLDDWLAGEPVSAWREPWTVRARRWMGRHRTLVTTGVVATLLVLIAMVAILVQQDRSNRRLAARNEELRTARARADGRVELALNAIDQYRQAVADNPQLKLRPEFTELRRSLLGAPEEFYRRIRQDIEDSQDTSPEAWAGLAKVVLGLAETTAEIDSRPNAIRASQEGIAVLDRMFRARPDDPTLRHLQARALLQLAKLQREESKLTDAVSHNERARDILQQLLRQRPDDIALRIDLSTAYDQLGLARASEGRFGDADADLERARETLESSDGLPTEGTSHLLRLALVYNHLGIIRGKTGPPDRALALYEHAVELQERLARDRPKDPYIRSALGTLHYNIGNLRSHTVGGGFESYERAAAIDEPLVREYPSVADFRMMYARTLGNLALSFWGPRIKSHAIPTYIRIAELQREGVELHPGVVRFRFDLGLTLYHLARAHLFVDEPQDALKYTQEGLERLEALLATNQDPLGQARSLLGVIGEKRSEALIALGRHDDAVAVLQVAIRHQRSALGQAPQSAESLGELYSHHFRLAALHAILGRADEALAILDIIQSLGPTDSRQLYSDARDMAGRWPGAMAKQKGRVEATATAAQCYGLLVVTMLERSREAGFHDASPLVKDPAFEPFRRRDDFQRLVVRMMDLAFPSNPLAD